MTLIATKEYTDPAQMLADYAARRARMYAPSLPVAEEVQTIPAPVLPKILVFPISRPVSVEEIVQRYKRGHPHCRLFAARRIKSREGGADTFNIMRTVALHFDVTRVDLKSARRTAHIVKARQIACWLMKTLTTLSLPQIGRHVGGRDHTTVLHAARKIQHLRETNEEMRRVTDDLVAQVKARVAE